MLETANTTTLRDGEAVELAVILGPDNGWAERIETLFAHKGEPWRWQNRTLLRTAVGLDSRYYVLHRSGLPFAGMLVSERAGAGVLNHVWTIPEERGRGASRALLHCLIEEAKARGTQALFLQTGLGSVAYLLYKSVGFSSVEPGSGHMHWYVTSEAEFNRAYFAAGATELQPFDLKHWLSLQALFQAKDPCLVRCVSLGQLGRRSTEAPILSLLADLQPEGVPQAWVLEHRGTTAGLGFAMWAWHPLWPGVCVVDLYCHPAWWNKGEMLLSALRLPEANRYVAYADHGCSEKRALLERSGFVRSAALRNWLAHGASREVSADIVLYEKE